MAEKKKTIKEVQPPKPKQSVAKALLLGVGLLLLGRFVIVGGFIGGMLVTLGLLFVLVGIIQFFQNRKEKKNSEK
jgi:predicted phage tail protein